MRIYGNYASQRRAYQDVAINQKCDNTWLLSGWAKAESIANTQADPDDADAPDDRFFGLIATIYYSDNTTENHYVPFCDDYTDWQYACGIVAPKKSNDESGNESLKITKIRVYTAYDYNCNTAYFDDVSLRAEPVETYKYDKDGKLTAVNATKNSKDSYTYNGPDLTQATQGVTGTYTYHYDSKHNMDKATTNSNNTMDVSYNSKGNAEQTKWYVTSVPDNWYLQTATEYSANGNQALTQTDANNIQTKNIYFSDGVQKGRLQTTYYADPDNSNAAVGNATSYSYNLDGSLKKTFQTGLIAAHYSYNKGMLSAISRKSFLRDAVTGSVLDGTGNETWQSYKFAYDSFGNPTAISVSHSSDANLSSSTHDITLAQYSYESGVNNGRLAQMTYGNGDSVSYQYDRFDRVRVQENSDSTQYRYFYNSEGALERQAAITVSEDSDGNTVKTLDDVYSFEYDSLGRLIRSRQSLGGTIDGNDRICEGTTVQHTQHIYDEENRITSQTSVLGGRSYTSSYVYNDNVASNSDPVKDGSLKQVTFSKPNKTLTFTYDSLKHLKKATLSGVFERSYSYRAITSLRSSNQISTLSYAANNSSLTALSYNYSYDLRGNITKIEENGSTIAEYTYNGQNQMTTEERDGITYTYTYDTAGNILNVGIDGMFATKSYTYSDSIWQDLLTAYNGHSIYYEGQGNDEVNYPVSGNPTNWYNGSTYTDLTWTQGRRLTSLSKGSTDISYTYDMNGIRSSKTVGTELHTYLTQNGQVVRETIGTGNTAQILDFVHDNNGQPFALCYSADGGEHFYDYFYITNMQGDVVRLVDSDGATVANYSYDAWGKLLSVKNASGAAITDPESIANLNPLRYRGYYYDTDTEWYYLQSRYYDPEIGRFINADDPEMALEDPNLIGLNLFAYCNNNPVMLTDEDGMLSNGWKIAITVGILAAAAAVMIVTGGAACGLVASIAVGAAKGAIVGAAYGALSGAVSEAATSAIQHRISTGSWRGAGKAALSGASQGVIDGAFSGAISGAISGGISGAMNPSACFVAGTAIAVASGYVAIETLKEGDLVWAWDEETGDVALKPIKQVFVNESSELIHLTVNGEEIVTTPTHPFYVAQKGWFAAVSLRAGDILVLVNGKYAVVEQVQHELLEAPIKVYNFEVEDYHTYFVCESGVLVHNSCDEVASTAKELGYKKVKGQYSHNEPIYYNPSAKRSMRYITHDIGSGNGLGSHNGGFWKAASSIKNLASKSTRTGTFNKMLTVRIGP